MLGETGTGKSIVARVIHYAGPRASGPLVTVFCPSLEKGMVEAELFGHRRGAFTGAVADRLGKVQAADHGTLFLDEIGELPLEIQPKLLRLLQEKTYERVGDAEERTADVRVIAATNRDLEHEVQAGRFRRDLYERLNYVPMRIPPLRERPEDIRPPAAPLPRPDARPAAGSRSRRRPSAFLRSSTSPGRATCGTSSSSRRACRRAACARRCRSRDLSRLLGARAEEPAARR